MDIHDLPSGWRHHWQPASFRGARFHVETGSKENGRRIVTHEFPKKDTPYSEDMGKIAIAFSVRGYCIQSPHDIDELFTRDYTIPRDALLEALETEGPGWLQLPLLPPKLVVCPRYRMTEDEEKGGYCVFDMHFVERGQPPFQAQPQPRTDLISNANALAALSAATLNGTASQQQGPIPIPLSGFGTI